MPFTSPSWVPKNPIEPPTHIPICDFMLEEVHGRHPLGYAHAPFTCGLSGKSYTALEVKERVDYLARGLAEALGWSPNKGEAWDKVAAIYSFNAIDIMTVNWAVHRLGGISTPANAMYSAAELEYQLKDSGAKCIFTCTPLLDNAVEAASRAGIPKEHVYLFELPTVFAGESQGSQPYKTVDQLIQQGTALPRLERLIWNSDEGARRVAFLCYSSGTSGLPKGVMISHKNVIANVLQTVQFEKPWRDQKKSLTDQSDYTEIVLGLLPMSHIYSLILIDHAGPWRGDGVIVLPKYEMRTLLEAVQNYKINLLVIVPPIVINMAKNKRLLDDYDLSSVDAIFTGAAPLGEETANDIQRQHPTWAIRQAYGMTESCTVVCSTHPEDVVFGSSGSLYPGVEARIVTIEGTDITGYDQPGELLIKSPSVVLGYLNNDKANAETFQDGWLRTGDEALVRKGPKGHEHVFIVDRIKELIKVKGLQVAPAELEAHLLTHPRVNDCAVIPVPDDDAGEVPKAFVVKDRSVGLEENDKLIKREIQKHVELHKSRHKWLKGGIEFVDVIPKSPSGKILRRHLRDKDKESRRAKTAKL